MLANLTFDSSQRHFGTVNFTANYSYHILGLSPSNSSWCARPFCEGVSLGLVMRLISAMRSRRLLLEELEWGHGVMSRQTHRPSIKFLSLLFSVHTNPHNTIMYTLGVYTQTSNFFFSDELFCLMGCKNPWLVSCYELGEDKMRLKF